MVHQNQFITPEIHHIYTVAAETPPASAPTLNGYVAYIILTTMDYNIGTT